MLCYTVNWGYWAFVGRLANSDPSFFCSIDECSSIIGSKLTEAKIEILKKSKRDIIFIIDKDKNGKLLAEKVLANGWKITFTPEGSEDVNDSVKKFGRCWTIYQLFKNIPQDRFSADLAIDLNCVT
jgi:DNA primase